VPDLALDIALLTLGVGVLYYGAEWLVRGSARLSATLGVSPIVVGLTVVSFGTSAPELVVSTVAAFGGSPNLALGNVMGSNLANIGLILGLTSIIRPLEVHARVVWREAPIMLLVTASVIPLAWDGMLSRGDGIILLIALVWYLVFVFQTVGDEAPEILGEYEDFMKASTARSTTVHLPDLLLIVAGSASLVLGGYCIVEGAVEVASALGISQVVIGLTVVAVGTSLPELATSLVAAVRNEADIAVGNVIGSNIFNVAAVLGVTSTLKPIAIPAGLIEGELVAVMFLSMLLLPVLRSGWLIRRWEGTLLLIGYVTAFIFLL
jgi:cation:H+ antiporter